MFPNIVQSIPLILNVINPNNFLQPIDFKQPYNATNNKTCSFAHLPKSTNNFHHIDPRCANDIDIIGQEVHIEEEGLYAKNYTVISGTVITNIGRIICFDNILKHVDKKLVVTERTMIVVNDIQHQFGIENGKYSKRQANVHIKPMPAYIEATSAHPDLVCQERKLDCDNYNPPGMELIWAHRQCDNFDVGGVIAKSIGVYGRPDDCVTLFDVTNRPISSLVSFKITHGNQSINKVLPTDLTLNDDDIARVQTNFILPHSRLVEYNGGIFIGDYKNMNSFNSIQQDAMFSYDCLNSRDIMKWMQRVDDVYIWNKEYPSLNAKIINPSHTSSLIKLEDPGSFKSVRYNQSSLLINGGANNRIQYTFKTYSKIETVYQMDGAVKDFECYFNGENINKVTSFTCIVTKVAIEGVANMMVFNDDSCTPIFTTIVQAQLQSQVMLPILKSGTNQTMKICTQIGICKTFAYSTEKIIINPDNPPASQEKDTSGFHWDWLNNFFGTLFHAISWWWNFGGWFGKLKSIGCVLVMAAIFGGVLFVIIWLKKYLWIFRILFGKKRVKKNVVKDHDIQRTVTINI